MEGGSTKLPVHERFAVIAVIGLLGLLTAITLLSRDPILLEEALPSRHQSYVITIKGAVDFPGRYQFREGSTIADALRLAHPTENANLQKITPGDLIRKGQTLTIPKQRKKSSNSSAI